MKAILYLVGALFVTFGGCAWLLFSGPADTSEAARKKIEPTALKLLTELQTSSAQSLLPAIQPIGVVNGSIATGYWIKFSLPLGKAFADIEKVIVSNPCKLKAACFKLKNDNTYVLEANAAFTENGFQTLKGEKSSNGSAPRSARTTIMIDLQSGNLTFNTESE